jgi:pimeloyl-ACP methyl ester carboxylesterase
MHAAAFLLCAAAVIGTESPEMRFVEIVPRQPEGQPLVRSLDQHRAVVLIQGLRIRPLNGGNGRRVDFDNWQLAGSRMVRCVENSADVFALAYVQNAPVDHVASSPWLAQAIALLRGLGYTEIVLIGHSAGGIIAREFVEDHPDAGVTKVIQVCAPNAGTSWARLHKAVPREQDPFVRSLTKEERQKTLSQRWGRIIPAGVEFVSIVGAWEVLGDGLVSCACQWPEDLQWQHIPAVTVFADHTLVMYSHFGTTAIADLVREPVPRWSAEKIAGARRRILLESALRAASR